MNHKVDKIAVIGAGAAGLVAARTMAQHGRSVTVFDKGRGPGGRMSTRRAGPYAFDHGAQYFTVRDPWTREQIRDWQQKGVVAEWTGRIGENDGAGGPILPVDGSVTRYVGVPGMNAIAKHLAAGLDIRLGVHVARVVGASGAWYLHADGGEEFGPFGSVLVSTPPSQAAILVAGVPGLAERARRVVMEPVWALMATFTEPVDVSWDGIFCNDGPLSWVARNGSKPGRGRHDSWVMHARSDWTHRHLENAPESVSHMLLESFSAVIGIPLKSMDVEHASAHRWRFALATEPLHEGVIWDQASQIGLCGDWCAGSRVEGALLSGRAAAHRVLEGGGFPG